MTRQDEQRGSRRKFWGQAARYAVLAAAGATTAVLALRRGPGAPVDARRRGLDAAAQECLNQSVCQACGRSGDCLLPQALSYRRWRDGQGDRS